MARFNLLGKPGVDLFHDLVHDPALIQLVMLNESTGTIIDRCTLNRIDSISITGTPAYGNRIAPSAGGPGFWALSLNSASSESVSFGDVAALNFERTDPFSLLAIVDVKAVGAGSAQGIISKFLGSPTLRGWSWHLDNLGRPHLVLANNASAGANTLDVRRTVGLSTGVDTMLGASYAGGSTAADIVLYENGASAAQAIDSNLLSASITTTGAVQLGLTLQNLSAHVAAVAVFKAAKTGEDFRRWAYLARML